MADIIEFKSKKRKKEETQKTKIDEFLSSLAKEFNQEKSAKEKLDTIKRIKGILKSRGVKYKVEVNHGHPEIKNNLSIFFPMEMLGFTFSIKKELKLANNWYIKPISPLEDPIKTAGQIFNDLQEKKNERTKEN